MRRLLSLVLAGLLLASPGAWAGTAGTVTITPNVYQYLNITVAGVTNGNNSPVFNLRGYPFTSYVMSGTQGVGGSAQWQGSNDGGTTWTNIGSAIGALSPVPGGTLTPSQVPYELYRLNVTAGDGTTSYNANLIAYGTRG